MQRRNNLNKVLLDHLRRWSIVFDWTRLWEIYHYFKVDPAFRRWLNQRTSSSHILPKLSYDFMFLCLSPPKKVGRGEELCVLHDSYCRHKTNMHWISDFSRVVNSWCRCTQWVQQAPPHVHCQKLPRRQLQGGT